MPTKQSTNIASEFWFYSQLHRLGYTAYITLGNTKSIDIAVTLKNNQTLTFDVKGKQTFNSGTYQYLPEKDTRDNHFFVFIDLGIQRNNNQITLGNIDCYIVPSTSLNSIAYHWNSSGRNGRETHGYGFEPKLLKYLKSKGSENCISQNVINNFKQKHNIQDNINFDSFSFIMSLDDFERKYYKEK